MKSKQVGRLARVGGVVVTVFLAAMLMRSHHAQAHEEGDDRDEADEEQGLDIAPVPLNLTGKNRELVARGSYIVNTLIDCNGCHSAGPQTAYAPGGNPYFGQPTKVNPATYLGGGQDFGAFPAEGPFPHIVSRNLTPDKTGRPEGGRSYAEFALIMRTGIDLDHVHPTCVGPPNGTCLPPPFDGNLLQIMPWPAFRNMTERDLRAIYEYLSAIPCVAGPAAPSLLHNDCQ